mgnify:CR=1 FL=1
MEFERFKLRLPSLFILDKENEMKERLNYVYVGINIHKETHTAVLMTFLEEVLGKIKINNNRTEFKKLFAFVEEKKGDFIPIYGLEDVSHFGRNLAIFLIEKDCVVKEVNSALSYMERKSYPTTKKNDEWDAQCVSAVLMRRFHLLPDANPQDYHWTMSHLVKRRNALVKATTALAHQFHDQLQNYYPSYKQFFKEIDCSTALAFFEQYPSPKHLKGVTAEELGEFLRIKSHNRCSTKRAERILSLVEDDDINERKYQFVRDYVVQSIARQIRLNQEEVKRLESVQRKFLKKLDYQLETISGVSTVTACALIGHIDDIQRFSNANKLANYAGIAPINHSSGGKGKDEQNKSQGNRDLYAVVYFLAIQQICVDLKGKPVRKIEVA